MLDSLIQRTSLARRFDLAMHCRFFRVSAARPHFKRTTKKVLDLATHAWLALVPHGGANLILTMVRRACRTQYNYMFIVRSSRCGIKCHKHADISLVCSYECYRKMEASLALWYLGPGVSCQSVTAPCYCPYHTSLSYFVTFFQFVCFRCFVRYFLYLYYIKYTDTTLIYDCTSFAVGMRHPRDGNGS